MFVQLYGDVQFVRSSGGCGGWVVGGCVVMLSIPRPSPTINAPVRRANSDLSSSCMERCYYRALT